MVSETSVLNVLSKRVCNVIIYALNVSFPHCRPVFRCPNFLRTYAVEEGSALVERAACPLLSGQAAHCTRPSPIIA